MNNDRNKCYNCQCNSNNVNPNCQCTNMQDSNNPEQEISTINKWINKLSEQRNDQNSITSTALNLIHDSDFIQAVAKMIGKNHEMVNSSLNNHQFSTKMLDLVGPTEDPTDPNFLKKVKEALINDNNFMAKLVVNIAQDPIFMSIVSQLLKNKLVIDDDFGKKLATKLATNNTLIEGLVVSLIENRDFAFQIEKILSSDDNFISLLATKLASHSMITKVYVDEQDQAILNQSKIYSDSTSSSKDEQKVIRSQLGDLSQLKTKTKASLVSAINELETTQLNAEEKQKVLIMLEKGIFGDAPSQTLNSSWVGSETLDGFRTPFDIVGDSDGKLLTRWEGNKIEYHKINEDKPYQSSPENNSLRLVFDGQDGTLKYFNQTSALMEEVATKGDLQDILLSDPEQPEELKYNREVYESIDFCGATLKRVQKITGLIGPTRLDHATNKAYVDQKYGQLKAETITSEYTYQYYNSYQAEEGSLTFTDYNPDYWYMFYFYLQIKQHKLVGFLEVPARLDPDYLVTNVLIDYSETSSNTMIFDQKNQTLEVKQWDRKPVKITKIDVFRKRDPRSLNK